MNFILVNIYGPIAILLAGFAVIAGIVTTGVTAHYGRPSLWRRKDAQRALYAWAAVLAAPFWPLFLPALMVWTFTRLYQVAYKEYGRRGSTEW